MLNTLQELHVSCTDNHLASRCRGLGMQLATVPALAPASQCYECASPTFPLTVGMGMMWLHRRARAITGGQLPVILNQVFSPLAALRQQPMASA